MMFQSAYRRVLVADQPRTQLVDALVEAGEFHTNLDRVFVRDTELSEFRDLFSVQGLR